MVKYLFEVLREFDETMKANFVFFLTGNTSSSLRFLGSSLPARGQPGARQSSCSR